MQWIIIICALSSVVFAQHRRERAKPTRAPVTVTNEFVDERNCMTGQNNDPWRCLCDQLNYERAGCEQNLEKFLEANRNLEICIDQPNYYLALGQKCHYDVNWDTSNDPAGKAMQFALDLFRTADPENSKKNFIISPISPQILLSQLTDGCSESARIEMIRTLRLNSAEAQSLADSLQTGVNTGSGLNKLEIASMFFKSIDVNLTEKFNVARKEQKIKMRDLDFSKANQAAHEINKWVHDATRGYIQQATTPETLAPDTAMMMLNAIFFKGTWLYKFNETETNKRGVFEVNKMEKVPAIMMSQSNRLRFGDISFSKYSDPDWGLHWVELPYEGDNLAMILLLPKARHQLDETLKQLNASHIQDIFKVIQRDYNPTMINLKVPKFRIRDSTSLVQPLQKLGIKQIFEDDRALSKLSNTPTKVSDVKQEAFLSVDEKGTIATAVTKITIIPLSLSSYEDVNFICDEPFVVMIVDKSKEIPLMMAKIKQPLKPNKAKN